MDRLLARMDAFQSKGYEGRTLDELCAHLADHESYYQYVLEGKSEVMLDVQTRMKTPHKA